jgi:hypothetical protein
VEEDNQLGFEFPGLGRRKIEANFAGGQVSSDRGIMLLRQVDRWLGFTKQLDRIFARPTKPALNPTFPGKSATAAHLWLGVGIRGPQ